MKRSFMVIICGLMGLFLIGCSPAATTSLNPAQSTVENKGIESPKPPEATPIPFVITSPALEPDNMIPTLYSCNGKDISLPISWGEPPAGTKSFALIMDDPDAKAVAGFTWIHWVVFNIPPQTRSLPENLPKTNTLQDGSIQGKNSFGKIGYGGPCPPSGMHHYYFKLYALDVPLDASPGTTSGLLVQMMKGHILSQIELITTYRKH